MSTPKLRVAIIGGGISGLFLAHTLLQGDPSPPVQVDLYEAGPEISTVGAGIVVWRRTWEILKLIGLDKELAKRGVVPPPEGTGPSLLYRHSNQSEGYTFYHQVLAYGSVSMHRAALVNAIKDTLPTDCNVHLSKKFGKYTPSATEEGSLVLHFDDGSVAEADVIVGADGVHSKTRSHIFSQWHSSQDSDLPESDHEPSVFAPVWSGSFAFRCLVPFSKLAEKNPNHCVLTNGVSYCGKDKHVVCYPLPQARLVNIIAYNSDPSAEGSKFEGDSVVAVPTQEVLDCYSGWEKELLELLECTEGASRWAIHVMKPLPTYSHENATIIGDAAHAMTPHFGAAAGQAIEDAYVLGRLLASPLTTRARIAQALQFYSDTRRPLADRVVAESRLTGLMTEFNAPGLYDGSLRDNGDERKERKGLEELGEAVAGQWEWQAKGGFVQDWEKTEEEWRRIVGGV